MLSISDAFGKDYNVDFNAEKYQLLSYSNGDDSLHGIYHNGCFVTAQNYANHLVNCTGPNLANNDITHVRDYFYRLQCIVKYFF